MIAAAIRQTFDHPDRAHAGEAWRKGAGQPRPPRWSKPADLMQASTHKVLTCMSFPRQNRTRLHSTSRIERPDKKVRWRAEVAGILPYEASVMRLISAVLFERNDEWQTSSRYMMIKAFARIDGKEIAPVLSIIKKPPIMASDHPDSHTTLTRAMQRLHRPGNH